MTIDITNPAPELAGLCGGATVSRDDERYEASCEAWALVADQRPLMVAYPADAAEVAEVVLAARRHGLRVVPQGTGHNAAPLGAIEDAILVRTPALNEVTIDPERKIARVGSGVLIEDVVNAAARHGLSVLHGSSPDVSVAGYSLGGGLGWQARKHGLQCNAVTAVELVNADGELIRADIRENSDLFWALRGGGGNFGVVTALEFRLFEMETVYGGAMVWPADRAHEVLTRWVEWCGEMPDDVTTSFRILNLPDMPGVPPFAAGRRIAVIDGAVLGRQEFGEEVLAYLRELEPELDMFGMMPAPALLRIHGDPEEPSAAVSTASMLADLPPDAIDAWVQATTGPRAGDLPVIAELRQLGGAVGRIPDCAGALTHFGGAFMGFNVGFAMTPEMKAASQALTGAIDTALEPWQTGDQYLNFVERKIDASAGFGSASWERLKEIRAAVDPDRVFLANHEIA